MVRPMTRPNDSAIVSHPFCKKGGMDGTLGFGFQGRALARSQSLELPEVVQVVASHGFNDSLEGHGAALGVSDGAVGGGGPCGGEEAKIPGAHRGEDGKSFGARDAGVGGCPLVLIEGLEDR